MKDFFISYNHEDKQWAEWIAWQLENAGFSTIIQAWDFVGNWVLEMNEAMQKTARTIAVLSPNYVKALYTQSEWANAFRLDPTGGKDLLIPVRVRPVDLDGVLAQIVYVDLVNIDEGAAVELLLKRVRGERGKPNSSPAFPSSAAETGRVTSRAAPKPVYRAFDDLFNLSDISEISNNCMSFPIVDKEEIRNEKLQENNNGLIDEYINEANDEDEETANSALIFLEHLGIKMKIYNSRKLLLFIKRSIEDDKKVGHLSLYLALIRRMLHTSTTLDKKAGLARVKS